MPNGESALVSAIRSASEISDRFSKLLRLARCHGQRSSLRHFADRAIPLSLLHRKTALSFHGSLPGCCLGERTSTQISGALGKQTRLPNSRMHAGEAQATSAALTPSAVEIGHIVMTRPWVIKRCSKIPISACSIPCLAGGGGVMMTWPCRSVSIRPSNFGRSGSESNSAQRARFNGVCWSCCESLIVSGDTT